VRACITPVRGGMEVRTQIGVGETHDGVSS
jgi:hypothetical protein